jgi:predicted ATP-dependent endonuclease of OLD family
MNQIKNIEIKNFKSIRHLKIEDCRRINVFVGYPNTGKSNLLEALSLFSIDRPAVDFSSFVRIGKVPTLFFDGNIKDNIEININGDNRIVGELNEDKLFFHWQLAGEGASFEKMGPGIQQNIKGLLNFVKTSNDDKVHNWDSIFKRLPRSDDFIDKFGPGYLSSIRKYNFQKDIIHSSGNYDFLSVPHGANLFDIIYTRPELRNEVAGLFKEYNLKINFDLSENEFSISKEIKENVVLTLPYKLIADTLQRLIFYKAAIASNKDAILLFEEPEAHMFPPYISKFSADVMYDENGNQFFINTHSPFVINDLMENLKKEELRIYVVGYKKETGETFVRKLTDGELHEMYQYGIDLYLNLENFLFHEQQ